MRYEVGQSVDFLYPSSKDGSLVRRTGKVAVVDEARQSITVNTPDGFRQFKLSRIVEGRDLANANVQGSEVRITNSGWCW